MCDKEIKNYNVNVSVYVPETGKYRRYKTIKCYTEEDAVKTARYFIKNESRKFKVHIIQLCYVTGWLENSVDNL